MDNVQEKQKTVDVIASTIFALIGIAAEEIYRERVNGKSSEPTEMTSDVVQMDSVTEQLNEQIAVGKRELEKVISKNVIMVDKIVDFREKLKKRHVHIADDVLKKYDEFFELKDS